VRNENERRIRRKQQPAADVLAAKSRNMFAGVVAGAAEAIVTMPMEVTKTRQQFGRNEGFVESLRASISTRGARGLYPALGLQMLQNAGKVGIRFGVYRLISQEEGVRPGKAAAGFLAGATEAIVWVTPCERLKILRIRFSHMPPISFFSTMIRQEGVRTLWVGGIPTVFRQSASVGFRFFLYELVVDRFCGGNAAAGGFFVGVVSTVLNNPIDVLKSEMQAATRGDAFKSSFDCIKQVSRTKGWKHFFTAGLTARILKIGIGQAVIFQVVDFLE